MEILKCEEVVKAVGGTLISGEVNTVFYNISTDSRNIKQGDLLFLLLEKDLTDTTILRLLWSMELWAALLKRKRNHFPAKF